MSAQKSAVIPSAGAARLTSGLADGLARGLAALRLELPEARQKQMLTYLQLLEKWNKTYNLTAIRDPQDMLVKHLLDSLAVLPWVRGERMLDIGSGAGLPGIPLAIARPDLEVVLLDANSKKTRFLLQARGELRLENVAVVHSRVAEYRPGFRFDTLVARALASLESMLPESAHLLAPDGLWLALKGDYPAAELEAVPPGFCVHEVIALTVPGLAAQRHLVVLAAA